MHRLVSGWTAAAARTGASPVAPRGHAEEVPTEPPDDVRQGRALPETMKGWLSARPVQPGTTGDLQELLDVFVDRYNTKRPHRSPPERVPPATAYRARPNATPGDRSRDAHDRVRRDLVDPEGKVTRRVDGRLHHLGIGMLFSGASVPLLVHDLDVHVVDATPGDLLRSLVVDSTTDHQGTGEPPGRKPRSYR